ncbi:ABC-2 transporter permease [Nosocomiicoccus ampullae]|uniref:ABC-2 transporter permease n=1 Tax=Nosocomiicoccus ampullae TaxID=489910 RepID=A0A9Q2CZN7_9STAP|nr:ABC-2 transporter permease [Nosocomiicoccus ampullae]MBB5176212.1 hypothetical protein [Nosocomiicoccus ampullae]QYA47378.1 ABC-2 transporter permease [Nosocomiicoccus ampullae]
MLNYMMRDIKIQTGYLLLFPVLIVFMLFMKSPINTILSVAMVYIPVNAIYLLTKSNINHFDLTLPSSRNDIVNYRYMSTLLYAIICGALITLILKVFGYEVTILDLEFALQLTFGLSVVFYPLNFALNTEKALLISMYAVFTLFMLQAVFFGYAVENIQKLSDSTHPFTLLVHIAFIVSCVLYVVSWFVCLIIIKRKDI